MIDLNIRYSTKWVISIKFIIFLKEFDCFIFWLSMMQYFPQILFLLEGPQTNKTTRLENYI